MTDCADCDMSGASLPAPINSPVIRRAGGKPALLEQGEALPLSAEIIDLKSGNVLMHGAAITPSPVLLWRLKVFLFLAWGFNCCKISWDSVMRMSADLQDLFLYEAFLYYNPLLLVTFTVFLWGVNLWIFSQSSVSYSNVFDLNHNYLTHREIFKCATWMAIVVPTSMTAYLYLYSHGEVSLAASQPVILYAIFVMAFIFPFDIFYLSSRYYFIRTLWRIILPLQAISFADFFLADILTSMSKVLSDLERSVCRMVNHQVATIAWFEADSICGSHSIAIPLVLVFPYLCRFFQCLRQYMDTKERSSLLNALKYSTAVPVIFLSALKYHVLPVKWTNFYRPLWLFFCILNSLYSFYWDITRDWDLSIFSSVFKFRNPNLVSRLLYGRMWVHCWVLSSNLVLRCTWTYKLSAHLRHNYLTVFAITALEIFRRFQWIFFRVENEWNKMSSRTNSDVNLEETSTESRLLGSSNHNV
ncbi:SPX and EXS domain-containing protein 5-like isoform X2 [Phalaenopsis equestris]|uniref:SPX and EXS domain-containing protein 5-like isoform X2 n=1 Tax=Phalaenopsis equestris TaxID=78828 RepID=UPI0009E60336|nr:SPX and EXS domain-containing protein 5-like isoform X2 [Phalaenopsis equestris]